MLRFPNNKLAIETLWFPGAIEFYWVGFYQQFYTIKTGIKTFDAIFDRRKLIFSLIYSFLNLLIFCFYLISCLLIILILSGLKEFFTRFSIFLFSGILQLINIPLSQNTYILYTYIYLLTAKLFLLCVLFLNNAI